MCGIAGFLRTDGGLAEAVAAESMADRLRHRGPDGGGVYAAGPAAISHRRLAIIDPAGGQQPVSNEDGSLWITYNGEIYNFAEIRHDLEARGHRFRTHCDTEVVVHAYEEWREECLARFRGMFAFAIWDARDRSLFLARDRFGIKPLYFYSGPGIHAFASELQAFDALADYRPTTDLQAIDLYLHLQYIPAPFTIFREVRKLPQAHWMRVTAAGSVEGPRRYWNLEFAPDETRSEGAWIEELDASLRETVASHLVSDVPFGAFLSGGIDSSTVVGYMSGILGQAVRTFAIGYEEVEYDETSYARQAAARFGTQHHEEIVRPDALAILPQLVQHYGEPLADSSAIPTWYVSRLAARHVKMVLSGDGGDELFAGYSSYPYLLWSQRKPAAWSGRLRHRIAALGRRSGALRPLASPEDVWYSNTAYFSEEARRALWRSEHHDLLPRTRQWFDSQFTLAPVDDLCSRFQYVDVNSYLAHDILAKVDVASMCHSLEVRVPLIDHVFASTVARIPSRFKVKWSGTGPLRDDTPLESLVGKYLLKRNAERFFSAEFVHRPKRGFDVPIRPWLAGAVRGELTARLLGSSRLSELFDRTAIERMLTSSGTIAGHGWRLWALLVLDEWFSQRDTARAEVSV